jgi:hypothetical protein
MPLTRNQLGLALAPALGLLAMVLPVWIWPPARHHEAPLFPLIRDAVEGVGVPQLLLLFIVGIVLGLVTTSRAWILGGLAIAVLPIVTVLELVKESCSHNLFPFEFAMYAVHGVVVVCGVLAIRWLLTYPPFLYQSECRLTDGNESSWKPAAPQGMART